MRRASVDKAGQRLKQIGRVAAGWVTIGRRALRSPRFTLRESLVFCVGVSLGLAVGLGSLRWEGGRAYRLVPSDVVLVLIKGSPVDAMLINTYTVGADGRVDLGPVYGKVSARGLTVDQLENSMRKTVLAVAPQKQVHVSLVSASDAW
ncbi:MAG: polysaccharide biosynthesis/export family protein [Planctomycetota bacterium]